MHGLTPAVRSYIPLRASSCLRMTFFPSFVLPFSLDISSHTVSPLFHSRPSSLSSLSSNSSLLSATAGAAPPSSTSSCVMVHGHSSSYLVRHLIFFPLILCSPPPSNQLPFVLMRGSILAQETRPSRLSHFHGCSQSNLSQGHASCLTFTPFPSRYQLTPSTSRAMVRYRRTSYSRPILRLPPVPAPQACGGIGEACKSTHVRNRVDTPPVVEPVQ